MNKWIDEQAEKHSRSMDNDVDRSWSKVDFTAGAQAMLARVEEIIEESKANDPSDACREDWYKTEGRESLRQEILEKLK